MSKNPSERKGMPGESEELDRDTQGQQGEHKQGQKSTGTPDWKKKEEKGREGQQQQHRQGEPMGQQPKRDVGKQGQPGGTDTEEGDERTKRPA